MADQTVGGSTPLDMRLLQLSPDDNVAVTKTTIPAGSPIQIAGVSVTCSQPLPVGHKIAIRGISAGKKVMKYGAPIGSAIREIRPGEYVHTHNVQSDYLPTYTYENRAPG